MTPADIHRLIALDAALASRRGLHVPSFAAAHEITPRTVDRLIALLRDVGHPSESRRDTPEWKSAYHHRYRAGVRRLFAGRKPQ